MKTKKNKIFMAFFYLSEIIQTLDVKKCLNERRRDLLLH